jgi:hypothetical protein
MLIRALWVLYLLSFLGVEVLSPNDWKKMIYNHDILDKSIFLSRSACFVFPCPVINVAPSSYGPNLRPDSFIRQDYKIIPAANFEIIVPNNGICWNLGPVCIPRYKDLDLNSDNIRYTLDDISK